MLTLADKNGGNWHGRLAFITEMMQDLSRQTDPQEMVRTYGERVQHLLPTDERISISRRGLSPPQYRITRSTTWNETINPWKEPNRLPVLSGGLLGRLIYADRPAIIDDLELAEDDPAVEYLAGHASLAAIPLFVRGEAVHMVVLLRTEPNAFSHEQLPDLLWISNLFGQATNSLVISGELQQAYAALDREFQGVGNIQRSLLPAELPKIPRLDLAAYYCPSQRAGGDYYDFFPLPDGRWGIFIADVSGHGPPAAVVMAITHCIAHMHPGPPVSPAAMLVHLNEHLTERYTRLVECFVTALYGIYDPADRSFVFANAGHPPPRVKRGKDGTLEALETPRGGLLLGVLAEQQFDEGREQLQPEDQLIFYTDGITETYNPDHGLFGTRRLDRVLGECQSQAQPADLLDVILAAVETFADGRPADDDRTVIVARVG